MKCVYCHKNEARKKYCSILCIKRAYVLRKNPNTRSLSNNDIDFWKSETGIGFKWEKYTSILLDASHIPFNNGPDLVHEKMGGIDVKVCSLFKRKNKRGFVISNFEKQKGWWVFNSNTKKKEVNWLFCICLNLDKTINKQLLIPAHIFYQRKTGITVGHSSIFDKYIFK